jgi:DNA-binding CsgD family transcriptional regulator
MDAPDDDAPVVAHLEVVRGLRAPTVFPLKARPYTLGRSGECDIVLPDVSVSRCHARLVPAAYGFRIQDLGSRHGTIVSDARVDDAELPSGAVFHLGHVSLRFVLSDPDASTADWKERTPAAGVVAGLAEVLDALHLAVVLVDSGGRKVLRANRSARAILDRRDGLTDANGLDADDALASQRLRRLLASDSAGGAVQVPRRVGKPLALVTGPVRKTASGAGAIHGVFITDPDVSIDPPVAALEHLYDLTRAESEVAGELLAGRTLEELSGELGISIHTARTHLKHILDKTDTHRQSELIRLLLLGPAQFRSQD